jgi:hypothetical protein
MSHDPQIWTALQQARATWTQLRASTVQKMLEAAAAEAAWTQLSATLPASDAKVATAESTWDAAVTALSAARDAERTTRTAVLNDLTAWVDPDPASDVSTLSAAYPIALFPVRLETRFFPPLAPSTLRLRIFPDSIQSDTHEPELTDDEGKCGDAYWSSIANGVAPAEAWRRVLLTYPAPRAAYLVKATNPAGVRPPGRASTWTRPAEARLLPDRWLVVGYRGGVEVVRATGKPIQEPLTLTISPLMGVSGDAAALARDPDLGWAADFATAVSVGMGVEIPLSAYDAQVGFDRIVVVGVKASLDPASAADQFSSLWSNHSYASGVAFIPQGSPTNNTGDSPAAYPLDDPNGALSFALQSHAPPPPASDGRLFTDAIGVPSNVAAPIAGASGSEQTAAQAMNTVVWSSTFGYYLRELMAPGFDGPTGSLFTAPTIANARAHFQSYVRGRGPLPAFRVGATPYGVLPVTSLRHWTGTGSTAASAADLISVIVRAATPIAPQTDHVRIGHAMHAPGNGLYTVLETGTPLAQIPAWCTFATGAWSGGPQADLYIIQQTGTASGNMDYSVLAAGSNYTSVVEHGMIPIAANADYAFALADWDNDAQPDLFAINREGATATEITILSGASRFQTVIFHGTTGLAKTDRNWSFGLADWDRDGIPDLVAVQTAATASQHVEIHVLSGASNFRTEILRVDTGVALKAPVDVSVTDWDGDRVPDIVLSYRNQPAPSTLTVTVLRGDQGWQASYPDLESNLAEVDPTPGIHLPNPSDAFVVAADWDGDGRAELLAVRNDGSIVTGALGVQVLSASPVMRFSESASLADPNRVARTTVASAAASLASDGSTDLVIVQAQPQSAGTNLAYRIARQLDACGVPARYAPDNALTAGPVVGAGLVGAGVAVTDLDRDGNLELVVFHADGSTARTHGSYRIGWKLDANGVVDHWSADVAIPYARRFPRAPVHLGGSMTLADLDGSGQPDMLVLSAERSVPLMVGTTGVQSLYYIVGKNLDATGQVTGGWGNTISVPFTVGTSATLGVAGIAVNDLDANGLFDVIVAFVEISGASRTTWYRIGRRLDANGVPQGGWSDQYRVLGTDGAVVAGISLARVSHGGWTGMLCSLVEHAASAAAFAPHVGASTDVDGDLLAALTLHASSPQMGIRRIVGPNTLVNMLAYVGANTVLPGSDWVTWYQRVQRRAHDLLATLGDPAWSSARNAAGWQPRMSDALVDPTATLFNQPLVAPGPLSETDPLPVLNNIPNYLAWVMDLPPVQVKTSDMALDNVTTRIDDPWPLLFYLARHSLLLEYASAAFAIDVAQGGASAVEDQDPEMFGVVPGAPVRTVWDRLLNSISSAPGSAPGMPVWQYLLQNGPTYSAQITELREALRYLATRPTAELHRLVSETLDTCSHRVDAWVTSLATRRLQAEMRPAQPTGLHLGAFGWLERVVPTARNRYSRTTLRQQVLIPKQGGGYIHAPSAAMASAAAVLRNAYMTRGGSSTVYAIDLSSERARIGRELLDAVRQGVELGAALGFRIERLLEANNLQRYIDPLRALCPLVPQHDGAAAQSGLTTGRMVLDGLKLRAMWPNLPWTTAPFVNAQQPLRALLDGELGAAASGSASWTDPLDCVADLATAESVYQTIRGNKPGAVAALDTLSQGTRPPEPEILRPPRNGVSLTHRVAAILGDPVPALASWPVATPRAAAEPHVDAWVGSMLGDPQQVRCRVAVRSHTRPQGTTQLGEITLADLDLRPLDVLQLARSGGGANGASGASELDRRIAWAAMKVPAAQGSSPDDVSITYGRDPAWTAGVRSFPEVLELARSINAAIGRSRPLTPSDLLPPDAAALALNATPTAGDAAARANAVYGAYTTAISTLQNAVNAASPSATTVAAGLASLSLLNLPAAVPRSTDLQGLLAQAQSALDTAAARKQEASALIGKLSTATGWDAVDVARDAVQAILGGDLTFVVGFPAVETTPGELAQAMAAESQLLAAANLTEGEPVRRWFAGAARVRPVLDLWRRVAMYRTAQGVAARSWTVAQLAYRSGDSWLALQTGGVTPRAGVVSLVLDRVVTPTAGASCAGLLLDEWAEIIPASTATTAVAMHYESPSAQAPQTILLAVPPSLGGNWNLDVLLSIVNETFDLTHIRATDGAMMGSFGQLLPATLLATNVAGDTVSTDFRNLRRAE